MAPISQIFAWTALAAFATAIPLKPRQQSMVTETDWVTVDVPVTLWVDENGTPLSTVASGGNFAVVPTVSTTFSTSTSTSAPAVSNAVPTVTSTSTPAPVSTQQPIQPPPPSSTTTPYVAPTTAAPTTTPAPPPPASSSTTTTPVDNFGRQASTAAAAASSPAAAAGGSTDSSGISASSSNTCTGTGNACVGDITHYDGGLGACGWNVNTASDMQIALPYGFMGTQSNGNPYCGKSLTIRNPNTGATAQATVGDKCMGCEGRSIDLTNVLFNTIGGGCDGRCSGFEWWFN